MFSLHSFPSFTKIFLSRSVLVAALLFSSSRAFAVSPMVQFNDLVAGFGEVGYQDGSFATALFHGPCGLAISPDGSRLFVADRDNNRIRVVLLDQDNQVQTLAGTGDKGSLDGEMSKASFNRPLLLCSTDANHLLVFEAGSGHLRELDLSSHQVKTLDPKIAPATLPAPMTNLTTLAFNPKEKALYFTRDSGTDLYKMDLNDQICSPLIVKPLPPIKKIPQTFTPGLLCYHQDHICVSDKVTGSVYSLNPDPKNATTVTLAVVGNGQKIAALASCGQTLYALPAADNPDQLWSQVAPVKGAGLLPLMNVWGDILKGQALMYFFNFKNVSSYFIADPRDDQRFFVSMPNKNLIMSLRDYRFDARKINNYGGRGDLNEGGISDFNYPYKKPPKTFRIIIAGDSRSFHIVPDGRWPWGSNRMEILAKRLEVLLNTTASLDDYPVHFQVLAVGHPNSWDALTWFTYQLPLVAQKYDVDLCIQALTPDAFSYKVYLEHPIKVNGIPTKDVDPEYLLKPLAERAKADPVVEAFYQDCLKLNLGDPVALNKFWPVHRLLKEKVLHDDLVGLEGRGYERASKEVQDQVTSAGTHRLYYLCFFPLGNLGSDENVPNEPYRELWKEITEKDNLHFIDLTIPFNVLKASYFNVEEINDWGHNNYHGHALNAVVLEHELLRLKLIPTPAPRPQAENRTPTPSVTLSHSNENK